MIGKDLSGATGLGFVEPGYLLNHDNGMLAAIVYPYDSGVVFTQDRVPHRMGRPGSVGLSGHTALTFGTGANAIANLVYQCDGACDFDARVLRTRDVVGGSNDTLT
ncbi:MAG: hypothetical protein AAF481_15450 [Acidobacteriota bacterium]